MVAFQPPEGLACLTARGLVEQRIAQELGADQHAWFTSHLMTCDACSSALAEAVRLAVDSGRLPSLDLPDLPAPMREAARAVEDEAWGPQWQEVAASAVATREGEAEAPSGLASRSGGAAEVVRKIIDALRETQWTPEQTLVPTGGPTGETHPREGEAGVIPADEWERDEGPAIVDGVFEFSAWLPSQIEGSRLVCSLSLPRDVRVRFEATPFQFGVGRWRAEFVARGFPADLQHDIHVNDVLLVAIPPSSPDSSPTP